MDSLDRKILEAFDQPAAAGRDPEAASHLVTGAPTARVLALSQFGDSPQVERALTQLLEQGWLRAGDSPGTYLRTEDGRLQLAGPRDITIYSRPGCHLCEEAKAQIAPILKEFGARLTEINIDEDPALRARYDYDVPVIFIGQRKAAKHRVDLAQFLRQLRDSRA